MEPGISFKGSEGMAGTNLAVKESATRRYWPMVGGPRGLASLGFFLFHIAGGLYALVTLLHALFLRNVVQLLVSQSGLFRAFASAWFLIPMGLVLITLLAGLEGGKTVRRWRRRQPEPDVSLRLRVLVYLALACLLLNAFFLSTPEAFAGPFRVRFPIVAEIVGSFGYGAYLLWWLLLPRVRQLLPPRVGRGLDLLGMNVALLLVLGEIGLRVLASVWPSPLLVTESSPSQIRRNANRQLPGTLRFGFPMNRGGHYDFEFVPRSGTLNRIVVNIGDSFSYGSVPHAYHFTTVAERALPGVSIYNMGYAGIGPSDYLYLLEHEALPLEPAAVVISLFVGNDLTEGPSPSGSARWYDADSYLLAIVWYRLQIMARAKLVDAAQASKFAHLAPDQLPALYPQLTDPSLEMPTVNDEIFFAIETRNAIGICLPDQALYRSLFEALTRIMQAAGTVPLAFVLIPEEFQVEDDIWQEVVRRSGRQLDRDLAQRTITAWLRARGVPVLDLLPVLRQVEPMEDGRRHVYHLRDLHFNARGNEVVGRVVARLVDSLLSANPAPLTLPRHLAFGVGGARQSMRSGWSYDEFAADRSFVWNDGPRSVFSAPLPRERDVRMAFEVHPFVFPHAPEQRVTVVLNGAVIRAVLLRTGRHRYVVTLPRQLLRDSPNTLEFHYAYAREPREVLPDSQDERRLAVAWYSIAFSASNP